MSSELGGNGMAGNKHKIQGRKVVVTGGAGFIGSHIVYELLKEDVESVVVYDDFSNGKDANIEWALKDKRVVCVRASILQKDYLNSFLREASCVFHLAVSNLLFCDDFPESAMHVNINGFFNVLSLCPESAKLVYSSSASVYGDSLFEPMTEDHPFNTKNFYGATKIANEFMAKAYAGKYGTRSIGLRYMNVYGRRMHSRVVDNSLCNYVTIIPRIYHAIKTGTPIKVSGDGNQSFDFVNVTDVARANICAVKSGIDFGLYNVGTGVKTSLNELIALMEKLMNTKALVEYVSKSEYVKNRVGCPIKAKEDIGFEYSVSLEDGLRDYIEWRQHDSSC